ncbi:MAG: ATP-binding cassette domain-containing protein [Halobacteriaceae archaeon]
MTDPPAIDATNLVKDYGDVRALDHLSLTVEHGEFFGLLGPNGAGKTTFIETLVGLAELDGGTASVFGHDVQEARRAVRDRISIAPQEYNVDRFFPIREVLEHTARFHGVPAPEARQRAEAALSTVDLTAKGDQKFHYLSGGMKRRFLLARALVADPDLLVLDEPTAGVDVKLRHDVWDVVRDLNDDGTTILLTTHYIEEAERLCDRVCILDEGQQVEVDTPAELRRRGTDAIRLDLDEVPAETAPLRDLDDVVAVSERSGGLTVQARRSGQVLPAVITALDRNGYEVCDVDVERASLEDVFVDLTRLDGDADQDADEAGSDQPAGTGESNQRTSEADDDQSDDERVLARHE